MSLKRILALADGGAGDAAALDCSAWLAAQHDSVVDVLPVYPDTAMDMIALGMTLGATLSQEAVEELTAAQRELDSHVSARARAAANKADVVFGPGDGAPRMTVLSRGLRPALALSRHLALADLVVVGQGLLDGPGQERDLLAQALLADRSPVLIARGDPDSLSGAAAIAWDGTPQAGRAVRAALPLLAMASEIHILQCLSGLQGDGPDPDVNLLNRYLDLHGVGEGVLTSVEGTDEGVALVAAAEARGAGLLVAGAWGHSRLRQAIFGGATRTFIGRKDGQSVLLAH